MADYVQGGMFGGLDYQPLGWDAPTGPTGATAGDVGPKIVSDFQPLQPLPALPSTFAPSSTSTGATVTSQGGAPSTGGSVAGAGSSAAAPSNATASPLTAGAGTSGSVADYFLRAVIIILGFIFVAIGLNMFRPGLIPNPARALRP